MREKWLLAGVLLAAIPAAEAAKSSENESLRDKNGEPVQAGVFTSRWGRLFSGNDKKFSGALSFSSGLKEQWMSIPNSSDTATEKKKINQTLNLSLQYSPYSFWFANITSRLPSETPAATPPIFATASATMTGTPTPSAWFTATTAITISGHRAADDTPISNRAPSRWPTSFRYRNRSKTRS